MLIEHFSLFFLPNIGLTTRNTCVNIASILVFYVLGVMCFFVLKKLFFCALM